MFLNGDRAVYKRVTEEIISLCKTEQEQQFIDHLLQQLVRNLEKRRRKNKS